MKSPKHVSARVPVATVVGGRQLYTKLISPGHLEGAALVSGRDLLLVLLAAIDRARRAVSVMQFVIDIRPEEDVRADVRQLLHALVRAHARGVSVGVLLPTVMAEGWPATFDVNEPASRFLAARGVRVGRFHGQRARPYMHAKALMVDDDLVVVGNANWTPSAFGQNAELSVAIKSPSSTGFAQTRFQAAWNDAFDVPTSDSAEVHETQLTEVHGGSPVLARFYDLTRGVVRPPSVAKGMTGSAVQVAGAADRARGQAVLEALGSARHRGARRVRLMGGQTYLAELVSCIAAARLRVWTAMSALTLSGVPRLEPLVAAVQAAAARGIDVRVLHDADATRPKQWAEDARRLSDLGLALRPWPLRSRLHVRAVLVDEDKLFVGSVGWTANSILRTEELTAALRDAELGAEYVRWFDVAWATPRSRALETSADTERLGARAARTEFGGDPRGGT